MSGALFWEYHINEITANINRLFSEIAKQNMFSSYVLYQ